MRQTYTTLGELCAGLLITYGVAQIYAPAGLIVGGVLLALFCWLADR